MYGSLTAEAQTRLSVMKEKLCDLCKSDMTPERTGQCSRGTAKKNKVATIALPYNTEQCQSKGQSVVVKTLFFTCSHSERARLD